MSLDARKVILSYLTSGPKTGDELREIYLGKRPNDPINLGEYETKYQAFRRALQSLTEEGVIEQPKYRLRGEAADKSYIRKTIEKFEENNDSIKRNFLMEDIEAECKKRDAISTPRLLLFLKKVLNDKVDDVQRLVILSIRDIASNIDESRREDKKHLKRLRKDYVDKIFNIASKDSSIEVRKEALKLLIEFGESITINIIKEILNSTPEVFRQFKSTLKQDLCNPYNTAAFSKNRLLRDYKDRLRDMLTDLRLTNDPAIQKRAEMVLWNLRHGPSSMIPNEEAVI